MWIYNFDCSFLQASTLAFVTFTICCFLTDEVVCLQPAHVWSVLYLLSRLQHVPNDLGSNVRVTALVHYLTAGSDKKDCTYTRSLSEKSGAMSIVA